MKKFLMYIVLVFAIWFTIHTIVIIAYGYNDNVNKADVILIFGNKVETNGLPSERLQSRLDEGLELFNKGMAPLIVVSGGLGKEGFEEAEVMKKYLIDQGIPDNTIIEDKNGYDTYQTAKNLKQIAKNKNIEEVIIVSQYYHILRAKLALNKFGFEKVYSAHAKMFPELRDFYSIPREIIGYYVYLFKDYN